MPGSSPDSFLGGTLLPGFQKKRRDGTPAPPRLPRRDPQSALILSRAPAGQEAESGDSWYFF